MAELPTAGRVLRGFLGLTETFIVNQVITTARYRRTAMYLDR